MLVVAHLPEREAVAPEMAAARVLRVEVLGVDAVDAVECSREVIAEALDDEVVVVRHQAESVDVQAEPLDRLPELGEEAASVVAVEVDRAACDTACRRVPDAVVGKRRARQPGHAPKLEAAKSLETPCGNIGTQVLHSDMPCRDPSGDSPRTGALRSRPFGRSGEVEDEAPLMALVGIVVDALPDNPGAMALVQPVRVVNRLSDQISSSPWPRRRASATTAARSADPAPLPRASASTYSRSSDPWLVSPAVPTIRPSRSATKNAVYDASTSRRSA